MTLFPEKNPRYSIGRATARPIIVQGFYAGKKFHFLPELKTPTYTSFYLLIIREIFFYLFFSTQRTSQVEATIYLALLLGLGLQDDTHTTFNI